MESKTSIQNDLTLAGRRTVRQEAEALAAFAETLDEGFSKACELLFGCQGTVVLVGMGKSGLVARKWAATLASTGTRAYFLNPAEASHGDLGLLRPADVLVALSLSGETEELGSVLRYARETQVPCVAITQNRHSSLAKQAQIVLPMTVQQEACPLGLAPTTSTTVMMALGDAVAVTLMQMRGFSEADFAKLHPGGTLGRRLWLRVSELMHSGAEIPQVQPDAGLSEVLLEMTQKRLGHTLVTQAGKVVGLITDGDLRRAFQARGVNQALTAKELMTCNPKRLLPNALAVEARELMEKNSIQQLLVEDESANLLGVVHLHDLLRAKVV